MKKAFTLLELMIAIAVLVTLMGLVFRLNIAGADNKKRIETVMRMQKLENCISGYYAAFGSYPPVKLHGSRNIFLTTNNHGIQSPVGREEINLWGWKEIDDPAERRAWSQVRAACRSQPVDCRFPFPDNMEARVKKVSEELKENVESGVFDLKDEDQINRIVKKFESKITGNIHKDKTDWRDVQLFKFGLMSYILPRYLVMMRNSSLNEASGGGYGSYAQWRDNNAMPCDALTGEKFDDWSELRDCAYDPYGDLNQGDDDYYKVANIPSQAVCARWMPNLKGICTGNAALNLFGVQIVEEEGERELRSTNPYIEIFAPLSDSDGGSSYSYQYVLDGITIRDGWDKEFYYYSPAPYQTYVLWSSGPNDRTFPPWVDRSQLDSDANECISKWIKDDIVHLSNSN